MVYYVRKATTEDLASILLLFEDARDILYKQCIPQWQNNTGPNRVTIKNIIILGEGYVLIEDNYVMGFGTITTELQKSYELIVDGAWEKSETYVSIHRFAVHSRIKQRGMAFLLLSHLISIAVFKGYTDIRIDTHPSNKRMQKVIKKCGFIERGNIRLDIENGERKVYQILI